MKRWDVRTGELAEKYEWHATFGKEEGAAIMFTANVHRAILEITVKTETN